MKESTRKIGVASVGCLYALVVVGILTFWGLVIFGLFKLVTKYL